MDLSKTNDPTVAEPTVAPIFDIEAQRRAMWKGAVQQELQSCVQAAADIRKKITEAKTQYKKTFYKKKFEKIQQKVMQMVAALQRLQQQEAAAGKPPQQKEHVHDENCQHNHAPE